MPTRFLHARYADALGLRRWRLAHGLRTRLAEGYSRQDLRADVLAGIVVGVVALPLSMALAIASGVAPQYGLYTAIVAGVISALLGGTRCQVTGPTAAFVVILAPVVSKFGFGGLLIAGLMAGLMLVGMGLARLGNLMIFIPHPVTTGFTAGIGVVIATIQIKDLFGLQLVHAPESFIDRWRLMWNARATASGWELAVGLVTLALLIGLGRVLKKIPAPLVVLVVMAAGCALAARLWPGFQVETIGTRFHFVIDGHKVAGIPPLPPLPLLPWHLPGPGGTPLVLSFHLVRELMPAAFAIAILGAIESLLAAVIADGMTGTKHDPNGELLALGLSNLACPFFGGIAATGALARTATNIRAGATSPLAAVFHAVFVLACTISLAPLVAYLPMASLAALLLIVARNMAEVHLFARIVRVAPRSDVMVLLTCFTLTVVFDMVVSVSVGVVLAALLFMRRMSELTEVRRHDSLVVRLAMPAEVQVYEIAGPLFFGAAQKALSSLEVAHVGARVVILNLTQVLTVDATGLIALESLLDRLETNGRFVVLAGARSNVTAALARGGIVARQGVLDIVPDMQAASEAAQRHIAEQHADGARAAVPPPVTAS